MHFATDHQFQFARHEVELTYHRANEGAADQATRMKEIMGLTSLFDYYLTTGAGDEVVVEAVLVKANGDMLAMKSTFGSKEEHRLAVGSMYSAKGAQFSDTLGTVQEWFFAEMGTKVAA